MTDKAFLEAVFLLFGRKLAKVPPFPSNNDVIKFNFATLQWELAPVVVGKTFAAIVKKVDESVSNTNTLQDDDELVVALSANKTYCGFIIIYLVSGSIPDYRFSFTLPTGATGEKMAVGGLWRNSVQATQDITNAEAEATNGLLQTFAQYFRIIMGSTAGDVNYQFSQQTIDGGATITKQGATLIIWEETA